jgi:trehalose 6-phosphate synthase
VLSSNAGAAAEIGDAALLVNPYDTRDTTEALERAHDMKIAEKRERAEQLRERAPGLSPSEWLDRQVEAASSG